MVQKMFKKLLKKLLIVVSMWALGGVAFAQDATPDELVRKSTTEVLGMLKADKELAAGDPAKVEKLANEKILPYFNFQRMTQLAVGRSWREATDSQKTALIDEFRRLLVRTYSASLSQFKNQNIVEALVNKFGAGKYTEFRTQPSLGNILAGGYEGIKFEKVGSKGRNVYYKKIS
jgi:ABC-type transporter MlaC component